MYALGAIFTSLHAMTISIIEAYISDSTLQLNDNVLQDIRPSKHIETFFLNEPNREGGKSAISAHKVASVPYPWQPQPLF